MPRRSSKKQHDKKPAKELQSNRSSKYTKQPANKNQAGFDDINKASDDDLTKNAKVDMKSQKKKKKVQYPVIVKII